MTKAEINAERKLFQLRDEILEKEPGVINGKFPQMRDYLLTTKLYKVLDAMPKPAVHHVHLTAGCPTKFLIELTYNDFVYYNDRLMLFKVSKSGMQNEGFISVPTLRKYWGDPKKFDSYLKTKIELSEETINRQESHVAWLEF